MDKRLIKIIDKNAHEFEEWVNQINSYSKDLWNFEDDDPNFQKSTEITLKTIDVFEKLCQIFIEYGQFKDDFLVNSFYPNFAGFSLIIKSKKTNINYYFGIDDGEIFLKTGLIYSENIRYMGDGFWKKLLRLDDLGRFELIENEFHSDTIVEKYSDLYRNKKGIIYRIFRNYMVDLIENKSEVMISDLQVAWDCETNFREMLINASKSLLGNFILR